jgi:hypothetical protein
MLPPMPTRALVLARSVVLGTALAGVLGAGVAVAQEQPAGGAAHPATENPGRSDGRWHFSIEPYLFIPLDVSAQVTIAGRTAGLSLGLGDILNLDAAFDAGLRFEAWKDRWGILFDGFYLSAKNSGSGQVTYPLEALERFGINTALTIAAEGGKVALREGVIDMAGAYRVLDVQLGRSAESGARFPRLLLAPYLGLRTNILWQTLSVETVTVGLTTGGTRSIPVNEGLTFSKTFLEPLIGGTLWFDFDERWSVGFRGDVSGFGINADRDLTWNMFFSAMYRFSPTVALEFGYRFNSLQYEEGSGLSHMRLDLRQSGITVGVQFAF